MFRDGSFNGYVLHFMLRLNVTCLYDFFFVIMCLVGGKFEGKTGF